MIVAYKQLDKHKYMLLYPMSYTSPRYGKTCTVPEGYISDGATCAVDIATSGWWVHDWLCDTAQWDDGTYCSRWQSSSVLYDILLEDGFWIRAPFWRIATYLRDPLNRGARSHL